MKKYKIKIICFLIISLSLAMPYIVVYSIDYYDFSHMKTIETTNLKKIIENHPIVQAVYNDYYSNDYNEDSPQYVVKNKELYSQSVQKRITELQNIFSREIEKLMQYKVIDQDILETSQNQYPITFGTIYDQKNPYLDQLLRMDKDYKNISFSCEKDTEKIDSIMVVDANGKNYTEKQCQNMAWHMIEYLELDDIEDWSYNQYGYESQILKIRVYCQNDQEPESMQLSIGVQLLGTPETIINIK